MTPPEITLSDFGNTQVTYKQALEAHHKLNTNERVSNLKGSNPNNDVPRKIAALENLSPEQKTNLTDNFGGRTRVHLLRMFNPERSEAEHKFAFACLEHLPNYFEKLKEADKELSAELTDDVPFIPRLNTLHSVLNEESVDAGVFWTLAPYLFAVLTEGGGRRKSGNRNNTKMGRKIRLAKFIRTF